MVHGAINRRKKTLHYRILCCHLFLVVITRIAMIHHNYSKPCILIQHILFILSSSTNQLNNALRSSSLFSLNSTIDIILIGKHNSNLFMPITRIIHFCTTLSQYSKRYEVTSNVHLDGMLASLFCVFGRSDHP